MERCEEHLSTVQCPPQEDRQWPFSSERGEHGEQPDACRRIKETCREGRLVWGMLVDSLQQSLQAIMSNRCRLSSTGILPAPNTSFAPGSSDAFARCRAVEHISAHVGIIAKLSAQPPAQSGFHVLSGKPAAVLNCRPSARIIMLQSRRYVDHVGKTLKSIGQLFTGPSQEYRQWPFSSERREHGEQPDACRRVMTSRECRYSRFGIFVDSLQQLRAIMSNRCRLSCAQAFSPHRTHPLHPAAAMLTRGAGHTSAHVRIVAKLSTWKAAQSAFHELSGKPAAVLNCRPSALISIDKPKTC